MAKVPTFEGGQRRAPLHQSNFTVRATPEVFGAATGRGLVALGQGVGNLGEAVSTVADLRAQNALKNAQADYMESARALVSDPETGFLSRSGSDAINGVGAVEAQLEDLARGIAEKLPGQVRPRFRDFRIGYNTDLGREMLRHKAEQTKAETRTASDRRIAVLKQEAIRNHADPVAHLNSLREAENEFRTMAGLDGLSDEVTEQKLAEYRDGVQSDIILQMAEADPLAAEAHYEVVKDNLQEETRRGIERRITPAVKIAKADAKAGALFAGLQTDGSTDPVDHVTKFLVKNVVNNAPYLPDDAASDTLSGSAEGDTLETPDQPDPLQPTLQGPTLERARQLEEVDDLLRRRGDALAHRLNHAGVMLSPGNLIFAQALGAPLAIAFNEADPSLPAAEVMAQAMGWSLSAEQLSELDQRLAGRSTGNFLAEFSTAAATLSGGPDVAAELAAISDPEERQFAEAGLAVNLSKATNQRRGEADERIARAFESLEQSETLSGIPPTEKAELGGPQLRAAGKYLTTLAAGGQPKTNFVLFDTLRRLFERDMYAFGMFDLLSQRGQLGEQTFKQLRSWQKLVFKDPQGAEEYASFLSFTRRFVDDHFQSVDVNSETLRGAENEKAGQFQTRFLTAVEDFRRENERLPSDDEMLEIAERFRTLLPSSNIWQNAFDDAKDFFNGDEEKATAHAERVVELRATARLKSKLSARDTGDEQQRTQEESSPDDSEILTDELVRFRSHPYWHQSYQFALSFNDDALNATAYADTIAEYHTGALDFRRRNLRTGEIDFVVPPLLQQVAQGIWSSVKLAGDVGSGNTRIDLDDPEFMGRMMGTTTLAVPLAPKFMPSRLAAAVGPAGTIRNINPSKSMNNCIHCAIATDAMLAGRPATALKLWDDKIPLVAVLEKFYGARFGNENFKVNVVRKMKWAGAGARGIVFASRGADKVGHVFNVVNQNGVVRFLDGQTGAEAVFKKKGYLSFHLLRTNKLERL